MARQPLPPSAALITLPVNVVHWLLSDGRGLSSEFIVEHVWGLPPADSSFRDFDPTPHPHDPADLARCLRLLDASPETRARLSELRTASPVWDRLVTAWDDLEAMLRTEIGQTLPERGWRAPKTYEAMKRVLDRQDQAAA